MDTVKSLKKNYLFANKYQQWLFIISSLAIIAGFILSIVSWSALCSQQCAATHFYRLFGVKFENVGLVFFPALTFAHFYFIHKKRFSYLAGLMLAGAVGAEMIFIYAQKVLIGHWCPVCLSIAASIAVASLAYFLSFLNDLKLHVNDSRRSETMIILRQGLITASAIVIGFLLAFFGLTKVDVLQAAENSIKDSVAFGNAKSDIDVYFFSDWQCPACRQVEPKLKELIPLITKRARLTFVDFTIHPSSLNFSPYNLSFMIHNKDHYLELRDALTTLSIETETPTDEQVEKLADKKGIQYKQLNYSDVALGLKYFKTLGTEFDINSTPTLVLVNEATKKGKKLYGFAEINEENINKAIDKLSEK
ncbi:MAG: thioredoxin domain-containing protein [Chlamydiales bacterium]|nr:thioredoxin domain-containing protein [Chlamydiales bacterium]